MKYIKKAAGSLEDISDKTGLPVEEVMLNAAHVILIDTSGSMCAHDAGINGSEQRHDVAERELRSLQEMLPGKIAVISFSSDVIFCPSGIPVRQNSGTNIYKALQAIKPLDGTDVKFYLISDGEDHDSMTVEFAKTFETPINCIYVGSEYNQMGPELLRKISEASRGKFAKSAKVAEFQDEIRMLMEGNNGK